MANLDLRGCQDDQNYQNYQNYGDWRLIRWNRLQILVHFNGADCRGDPDPGDPDPGTPAQGRKHCAPTVA